MPDLFSSFYISNSNGLLALFILLVPIIIHLINPNKAKLVWIVHIQLIKSTDYKRVFQLKWQDILLLFLRLLMLIAITLILVNPNLTSEKATVDGEEHYLSIDWLRNATKDELRSLDVSLDSNDQYFILEDVERVPFENLKDLKKSAESKKFIDFENANYQSDLIYELTQRTNTPRNTHLYLTNRLNNYSEETMHELNDDSIIIHLHNLEHIDEIKNINIVLIHDKKNKVNASFLQMALNALSLESKFSVSLKTYSNFDDLTADTAPRIILNMLESKIDKQSAKREIHGDIIDVSILKNGLLFKNEDNVEVFWHYSKPLQLINILSKFINHSKDLLATKRVSKESILNGYVATSTRYEELSTYSKPLNNILIFLFCLVLLVERLLVIRRDVKNV